jgi:DNA-binding response OmpR family regulator
MPNVLIIEPDIVLAGSISSYLKLANFSSSQHRDPQAALRAADQKTPDVIVAELQLAGRSGVEFLYEFRSYPDWQTTPIIIFTNLSPQQIKIYVDSLLDLAISACLYKSHASLDDLLQAVQQSMLTNAKV